MNHPLLSGRIGASKKRKESAKGLNSIYANSTKKNQTSQQIQYIAPYLTLDYEGKKFPLSELINLDILKTEIDFGELMYQSILYVVIKVIIELVRFNFHILSN